jgi:hypothetical protein
MVKGNRLTKFRPQKTVILLGHVFKSVQQTVSIVGFMKGGRPLTS